jgi:NhaP-type Na+/H+ or K+/H+ antiporter
VIENTRLLILPFAAYLPADKVGASGVLAVVATGLYFGRYGSSSLTAAARLQQREIWDLIVFLLTGMSFLLVGLELRPILDSLVNRESGSLVIEALSVVGVVIVVRMVWIFGATALPGGQRLVGTDQRSPRSRRETAVIGWAGMRGAVSLAAALALPQSFPERNLLVFLAFAVIVATLVGQGLTLPLLIRRFGLVTREEQDVVLMAEARRRLTVLALSCIDDLGQTDSLPRWSIGSGWVTSRNWPAPTASSSPSGRRARPVTARKARATQPPTARGTSMPNANCGCWSSPRNGTSSTNWWPDGRSPSEWPAVFGPHSMSTRPRCAPDQWGRKRAAGRLRRDALQVQMC